MLAVALRLDLELSPSTLSPCDVDAAAPHAIFSRMRESPMCCSLVSYSTHGAAKSAWKSASSPSTAAPRNLHHQRSFARRTDNRRIYGRRK